MMAAASNTNNHSPRNAGDRQAAAAVVAARGVASPWTQIVRGGESESIVSSSSSTSAAAVAAAGMAAPPSPSSLVASSLVAFQEQDRHSSSDWSPSKVAAFASSSSPEDSALDAQPECSDNSNGNDNAAKKSAWNKPSNGGADGGPVMGAFSWPALSESTRASPKSSSSESLKALSDGSVSVSQGTGIASSSSQKQTIANNANPVSTLNHATPTRHKSTKRGGGSVSVNGGFHQPPPITLGSVVEMSSNNAGKPGSSVLESSPRDQTHKETGQTGGFGSHSHSGNDHGPQRNSFRRGNGGSHPRGDGHYHNNYGGRRDQDRGNHDWNLHRNFNGRDAHLQPHRAVPRAFIRPPPHGSTPFIPPPPVPVRPFGNPMVYPEMPSPMIYVPSPHPESIRGVHLVAPMPPHTMFFPVPDPQLHSKIVNQIDYYFSNENLIKDTFLRQNMDEQGCVPIKLIAGFKKVTQLTDNIQLILEAVRTSAVVEVQGDKVRKRNDWMRWVMPPVQFPNVSSPQSLGSSSHDILAANVQNVSLEENEAVLSRSSSGDPNSQPQQSIAEETGQATFQAGSESSISAEFQ